MDYSEESIQVFLNNQEQLFGETIAETPEEAREILEENMAVEVDSIQEVKEFFDENGMDISGMPDEEIISQSEVFPLADGRFLVVVG